MLQLPCIECKAEANVDNTHVGPAAGVALRTPLEAIHRACAVERGIDVHTDGAVPWLLRDGREFREYSRGVFLRSNNALSQHIYFRDEQHHRQ